MAEATETSAELPLRQEPDALPVAVPAPAPVLVEVPFAVPIENVATTSNGISAGYYST